MDGTPKNSIPRSRVKNVPPQRSWLPPTKVIGICLNTYDMTEARARAAVAQAADETGLPAADPVRFDAAPLVEAIIQGAMPAK